MNNVIVSLLNKKKKSVFQTLPFTPATYLNQSLRLTNLGIPKQSNG